MIVTNGIRYAVKIECEDGRAWLAIGDDLNVRLLMNTGDARKYKAELQKHLGKKTKLTVVRVYCRIEEMEA